MNALTSILNDFGYTSLVVSEIMTDKEAKERMDAQKAKQLKKQKPKTVS